MTPRLFARFFDEVDAPPAMRDFVMRELSSPTRHWHGLLHHALMLRAIGRRASGEARRRLILAVLFHDIVYDAMRGDTEEASAAVARRWLGGAEADAVAALILATKHHDLAAADPVTRMLLDADLAVLWTGNAALYRHYAAGIRAEYAHVPEEAYRAGRTAVLRKLERQIAPFLGARDARLLSLNLNDEMATL